MHCGRMRKLRPGLCQSACRISESLGPVVESGAMPRWRKSARAAPPPPQDFVLIRISNQAGKYATLGVKGDLLVAPKAQAAEVPATEAPRQQLELERRGSKRKWNQC